MGFVRFNSGSSMTIGDGYVRVHWRSGRVDQLDVEGVKSDHLAVNVDDFCVHIRTRHGVIEIAKGEREDESMLVAHKIDWWAS